MVPDETLCANAALTPAIDIKATNLTINHCPARTVLPDSCTVVVIVRLLLVESMAPAVRSYASAHSAGESISSFDVSGDRSRARQGKAPGKGVRELIRSVCHPRPRTGCRK